MKTVYLCGAINGCTDEQCQNWREHAKTLLTDYQVLDPMRRDYRGVERENASEIVEFDIQDIDDSESLLVNAEKPSWGTAMELFYAHRAGKRVISIVPDPAKASPWLVYHSSFIVTTVNEAVAILRHQS